MFLDFNSDYYIGSHIKATNPWFLAPPLIEHHHGIYVGNGEVIHNSKRHGKPNLRKTSLAEFAKGRRVSVVDGAYHDYDAARRAERALYWGIGDYTLLFNNCEHFARHCKGLRGSTDLERKVGEGINFSIRTASKPSVWKLISRLFTKSGGTLF